MGTNPRSSRTTGPRSRGAVAVEFALVAPVMFALIFGAIDFGFVMSDRIRMNQGLSETARAVVIGQLPTDTSCAVNGAVLSDNAHGVMCAVKGAIGGDDLDSAVRIELRQADGSSGSFVANDTFALCVQRRMESKSGMSDFLLGGVTTSKVVMRIEDVPEGVTLDAASETSLADSNWSFC